MKKLFVSIFLIVVLLLPEASALASIEQGIFEMHKVGNAAIVATWRETIAAPRQSVQVYRNYGIIDTDGNYIIQPVYDIINPPTDGRALFMKDGRYGYFDEQWNVVIQPVYKAALQFSEGLACVADENGLKGYIDKDGNTVIPFMFEHAYSFEDDTARVGAYEDGYNLNRFYKEGKIDKSGNIIEPIHFDHQDSYEVVMSENNVTINGTLYANSGLQYPFINHLGYTYIPLTYHGCREMGFVCEWNPDTGLILRSEKDTPGSIVGTNTMTEGEYFEAELYRGNLTIGGKTYTAGDVYYPLLTCNDIVYMPVLWKQGMEALGLEYSYDLDSHSLIININR